MTKANLGVAQATMEACASGTVGSGTRHGNRSLAWVGRTGGQGGVAVKMRKERGDGGEMAVDKDERWLNQR